MVEINELLSLEEGGACGDVQKLAEKKLVKVNQRLQNLSRIEAALSKLVKQCSTHRGRIHCPIIDTLTEQAEHQLSFDSQNR